MQTEIHVVVKMDYRVRDDNLRTLNIGVCYKSFLRIRHRSPDDQHSLLEIRRKMQMIQRKVLDVQHVTFALQQRMPDNTHCSLHIQQPLREVERLMPVMQHEALMVRKLSLITETSREGI